jgi:hypothetical protein
MRLHGATISPVSPQNKCIRAGTTKRYPPRNLVGIWATAPYLHNNSVPTLKDLLSTQRPGKFKILPHQFDTKNVGIRYEIPGEKDAVSVFDTTSAGNSNTGHNYGTNLTEYDKVSLLEYLKAL